MEDELTFFAPGSAFVSSSIVGIPISGIGGTAFINQCHQIGLQQVWSSDIEEPIRGIAPYGDHIATEVIRAGRVMLRLAPV